MRQKLPTNKRSISRPISVFPDQLAFIRERSNALGISISEFYRRVVEYERKHRCVSREVASEMTSKLKAEIARTKKVIAAAGL